MQGQRIETTDAVGFVNRLAIAFVGMVVMYLAINSGSTSLTTKGIFLAGDLATVFVLISFVHEARQRREMS